jgi:hypothetical protein
MRTTPIVLAILSVASSVQAVESVTFPSETGDTLMIHQLKSGEVWGSLIITDHIVDSFADHELIVLQVDRFQPIKLDQEKRCNTPAGKSQKVSYKFDAKESTEEWLFSQIATPKADIFKVTGWDKETYQHMKSDRRPEVVDFPIKASLAINSLWQQFKQGEKVVFRYTTSANESRQASFTLMPQRTEILKLSSE